MGRRFELGQQEVSIGRGDNCTICVSTDQVSRKHATVQCVLGKYYLVDKYTESHVEQQYFEHAFNLASMDALTGAFNKRYFDETFGKEVQRAQQAQTPLSIVLFDIDHFKKINDGFGHPAGDAVLKNVSAAVASQLRDGDALFRVGGEEFALVLVGTPRDLAIQAAEAVRKMIESLITEFMGARLGATLSLGVAELGPTETPAALYQRADELLYAAKRGGRNRVMA